MTTTKTIAPPAIPATPTVTKLIPKTAVVKTVTATPVAPKKPVKKTAPRRVAAKKPAAKKPLSKQSSQAFAPGKTLKPVKKAKVVKAEKLKKPKLVRDSFTIPKIEYVVLEALKQRATKLTRSVKKSELLRAGIKALAALSDAAFLSALEKVPTIKTGRPASAK